MKEQKHPVGPAFYYAREEEAAWRQQQIAALTQEQSREYDCRAQDEQKKLDAVRHRIDSEERKRVEIEKQNLISGKPIPELRRFPSKSMSHQKAAIQARTVIEQKSKADFTRAGKDARNRLDGYLRHAERERAKHRQPKQTARGNSNGKAQNRADDALARAFQKAEAQQQQNQTRSHGPAVKEQENNRERSRD